MPTEWIDRLLPLAARSDPRLRLRLLTLLVLAALATGLSGALGLAAMLTGHQATWPRFALGLIAPAVAVLAWRRPARVWPHHALMLSSLIALGLTAQLSEPLDVMPLFWASLVPLVTTMTFSRRVGLLYLGLTLALFAAVLSSEHATAQRPMIEAVIRPFDGVRVSAFFIVVSILAALFDRDRTRAMRAAAKALAEAEEEDRRKSRFLSAMSHELRTPLNGVQGMVELLLGEPLGARERETLELARRSGRAMSQAIEDVVRSTSQGLPIPSAPGEAVRLAGVVEDVLALSRTRASRKGLTLGSTIDPQLPAWIRGDEVRLRQVLHNLVGNAVKFTERGSVQVVISPGADGTIEVAVVDTGIGIPSHALDRVFARFEQVSSDHGTRFGGSGLGLAITQQLLESMGATLQVSSQAGEGTRFSFALRADAMDVPAEPAPAAVEPTLHAGRRVLAVDDNVVNLRVLQLMLERAGFVVETAANGARAVEKVQQQGFDAVLMDCHMPELDGYAATRAIRALPPPTGLTPIVAVTAAALPDEVEACFDAGMDDVIQKPVERARVLQALDALWSGPRVPRPRPSTPPHASTVSLPVPATSGLTALGGRVVAAVDALLPDRLRKDHEARMRARVTLLDAALIAVMGACVAVLEGVSAGLTAMIAPLSSAGIAAGVLLATRAARTELIVYRGALGLSAPVAIVGLAFTPWLAVSAVPTLAMIPLYGTLVLGRKSGLRWALGALLGTAAALVARGYVAPGHPLEGAPLPALDLVHLLGFTSVAFTTALFFDLSRAQGREAAEAAGERARAAARAKTDFLANMTHELRTPMSGIIGLIELLVHADLAEDQREKLRCAQESGRKLLRLIDDVLDYARLDRGKLELVEAPSTLAELLEPVHALARAHADAGRARLSWSSVRRPEQRVSVDRMRLGKVMETLVDNAFKFAVDGRVDVECRWLSDCDTLVFVVEDDGPGMTPEVQRRVLDPFEQADSTIRRSHDGAGLGLALARALIAEMRGALSLQSVPGSGTRIELRVALRPLEAAPAAPPLPERVEATGLTRVLVVDDAPVNRAIAGAIVRRLGFEPAFAQDGLEALAELDARSFAAVLMDCQMPVLDGLETMRRIRTSAVHGDVPIVAITASNEASDLAEARAAGADEVLSKPLLEAALLEAIGRAPPHALAEAVPRVGASSVGHG